LKTHPVAALMMGTSSVGAVGSTLFPQNLSVAPFDSRLCSTP